MSTAQRTRVSVAEAARLLGVSQNRVRQLIRNDSLRATVIRQRATSRGPRPHGYEIRESDLVRFAERERPAGGQRSHRFDPFEPWIREQLRQAPATPVRDLYAACAQGIHVQRGGRRVVVRYSNSYSWFRECVRRRGLRPEGWRFRPGGGNGQWVAAGQVPERRPVSLGERCAGRGSEVTSETA
jgi:excisionase family DNA binding protein